MATGKGTSRPSRAACFVDPVSGERLADTDTCDAHGTDLIGVDEYGVWWGTERAAWVLHEHPFTVQVRGRIGRLAWEGHFVGTEDAAIEYAETHGVVVDEVESGDPEYELRQLNRMRQRRFLTNACNIRPARAHNKA